MYDILMLLGKYGLYRSLEIISNLQLPENEKSLLKSHLKEIALNPFALKY